MADSKPGSSNVRSSIMLYGWKEKWPATRKQEGNGGAAANSTAAATTYAKAIYFITKAANNSVVALKVAADGSLPDGSTTAAGGPGLSIDSTVSVFDVSGESLPQN